MHEHEINEFAQVWSDAWSLYGKEVTPGILDLCFNALQRFELRDIRRALSAHVNNTEHGVYAPKPADVVKFLEGDTKTKSLTAWSKVEKAIRHIGPWQSIVLDDPTAQAVIAEMGGWIDLCKVTEKELPFKCNEFVKRYEGYAGRQQFPTDFPKVLVGIAQAENEVNGQPSEAPVMIGNPDRARLVYERGGESGAQYERMPKQVANLLPRLGREH